MSANLLTKNVWSTLRSAARRARTPSWVAVAYFGKGASSMLPLRPGSRLVVDASETAVKGGQTCPAELRKQSSKGVRIFSVPNLHAKVFVFGNRAFVGSANVSQQSAYVLTEAVITTSDRSTVSGVKDFVRKLCLHELGPESLSRLQRLYRPPRIPNLRRNRRNRKRRRLSIEIPRVLIAQVTKDAPPAGSEGTLRSGLKTAKTRMVKPRQHKLDRFWIFGRCPYRSRDIVIQVVGNDGEPPKVIPYGEVIYTRTWRSGGQITTFVYLEEKVRKWVPMDKLARQLGRGSKKILSRSGVIGRVFAEKLLEYWNR